MAKYIIFGNGWVGNKFRNYLRDAAISMANICDRKAVHEAIEEHKPSYVINAAGKTGKPNIDWCEDHKLETFLSNVDGPVILMSACLEKKLPMFHIGSGCIYSGDNRGKGFGENDTPNYFGSFYSRTKLIAEGILRQYPVLQVRIRMPVDKEPHDKNLITKLSRYKKVIAIPQSLTVLDSFFFAAECLMEKERIGVYNVTNPGAISFDRILQMYKEIVNPTYKFDTFSFEELQQVTKTGRSNCILNTEKLQNEGINLPPIEDAVRQCLITYSAYQA